MAEPCELAERTAACTEAGSRDAKVRTWAERWLSADRLAPVIRINGSTGQKLQDSLYSRMHRACPTVITFSALRVFQND